MTVDVPSGSTFPAGFPVVVTDGKQRFGGSTDTEGTAIITCVIPVNCQRVTAMLDAVVLPPSTDESEITGWKAAQQAADRDFVLPPVQSIVVQTGQSVYSCSFTLERAVSVAGRVVTQNGQPVKNARIERPGITQFARRSGPDGAFEIGGIKKGADSWLFIVPEHTMYDEIVVVSLDAAQNNMSRNIGDVIIESDSQYGRVSITCEGQSVLADDNTAERRFVSMIRLADRRIVCNVTDTGGKVTDGRGEGSMKLPVGDYVVLPGPPWKGPRVLKCLRLLKAGRQSDLTNAGLTVLHVQTNETVTQTVDLSQEIVKIDGIAE